MQFDLFDAGSNTILGSSSYAEFKERLTSSGCNKCPLSQGRTNIVVERGDVEAHIMTIGEGPGEQEDQQGLAFVGRAGQLFDKIMGAVGIDTDRDMLVANVVLYHPAALLYNAKLKPAMREHVKRLRRYLEENGLFRTVRAS